MDYNLPGSSVHEIIQARILEWVAMPSSRRSSQTSDQIHVSYVSCIGWQVFTTSATLEVQIFKGVLTPILLKLPKTLRDKDTSTIILWGKHHLDFKLDKDKTEKKNI